ncbi:MAG: hypothetical protein PUC15_04330 [Lentisphaeria bacterium]|nr:hypothetical protein [Lentisphaeria bacterium]
MPGNFRVLVGTFSRNPTGCRTFEKYTGKEAKNQAGKAKNGEIAEKKGKKGALAQNGAGFLVKTS